jgi:hypothetical protein
MEGTMALSPLSLDSQPREDLVRLSYRLKAPALMWRMMEYQEADPAAAWWRGSESMLVRAIARCIDCPHTGACRAWFERHSSPHAAPDFCPNNGTMAASRIMASAPTADREGNSEPSLDEVLDEPIVRRLMAADRASPRSVLEVVIPSGRPRAARSWRARRRQERLTTAAPGPGTERTL